MSKIIKMFLRSADVFKRPTNLRSLESLGFATPQYFSLEPSGCCGFSSAKAYQGRPDISQMCCVAQLVLATLAKKPEIALIEEQASPHSLRIYFVLHA